LNDNKLQIRDARADEYNEVALVLKKAYQQYEGSLPPPAWESYLSNIMDIRSRLNVAELIVAEVNGKLAGTVTLYSNPARAVEEGWPAGWAGVRLLGVLPEYRGRGIGRALMEECIKRCRNSGIHTLGLHTSELMDVARRMYEKMGFRRIPELDHHPAPGITVMAYRLDI
jgi:ribosomal protein S18 acetylase RimI-like enzyme